MFLRGETHMDVSGEMNSIEIRHFSINRILLLAVGLWPYHRSKLVQFQAVLFLSVITSFIIFQVRQ